MGILVVLVLLFSTYLPKIVSSETIVTLPNGQIQGRIEVTHNHITFYAFQQIPYAAPPVGKLRFMAPEPAKRWDGILDCTVDTKICRQMHRDSALETEDCLYVNVYTPVTPGSNDVPAPVMYYIHGGGFEHGNSTFDAAGPHFFMDHGVVIVTVNYRLGPLGFLSTEDTVIPGNNGLKDQLLGLKWVQENIYLFGGDPTKVTIFGQDAGGASVTYHLLSKQSSGLFRAAIAQSGSALNSWAYQRHARDIAYQLAAQFDSSFNGTRTSAELLHLLQNVSEEDLDKVASSFKPVGISEVESIQGYFYAPVLEIEHDRAFITEKQYSLLESGDFNKVPLVIGICAEESLEKARNSTRFADEVIAFEKDVRNLVSDDLHITDDDVKTQVGEEIRMIYSKDHFAANLSNAIRFYSDTSFTRSVIRHAQIQSNHSDVYFYQFSYAGNLTGRPYMYLEGAEVAPHSGDLRYQWAINNQSSLDHFPPYDVKAHERYMKLLTDFSKYLNPTPEKSSLLQNVTWPKVTSEHFYYLDIGYSQVQILENPKSQSYAKWVKVYDKWGIKPFDTY